MTRKELFEAVKKELPISENDWSTERNCYHFGLLAFSEEFSADYAAFNDGGRKGKLERRRKVSSKGSFSSVYAIGGYVFLASYLNMALSVVKTNDFRICISEEGDMAVLVLSDDKIKCAIPSYGEPAIGSIESECFSDAIVEESSGVCDPNDI